jgi:hypothetical protein
MSCLYSSEDYQTLKEKESELERALREKIAADPLLKRPITG